MTQSPPLFDPLALARNRQRAAASPAQFLHDIAAAEFKDRLAVVNRSFTDTAVVSGFPTLWAGHFPAAQQVAEADTLDLAPESHDLILHALSLHWANDPVGQLIQCRRALRPDGLLLVALFGGQTLAELRGALARAEAEVTGGLSPRIAPMAEIRDLGGLMQRAGLALPVADNVPLRATYAHPLALMHELRHMGEANAMADRLRRPTRAAVLRRAQQIYRDDHALPDGRIPVTYDMIFLTGWAPDASQPRPLRPGSAASRLAEALNTSETPLPD